MTVDLLCTALAARRRHAICLQANCLNVRHEDENILTVIAEVNDPPARRVLMGEDDKPFLERLSRAMETRGFTVTSCDSVSDGLAQIGRAAPAFAGGGLRLRAGQV